MQELEVSLSIPIPANMVLISKVELKQLKDNALAGVYWTMKDLENRTGKKQTWLKENILYQPRFKKQLDLEHGGFVYYPKNQGEKWTFHASKMADFLDKNFSKIHQKAVWKMAEKYVTFTGQETYFTNNVNQVSKLERVLREQKIEYRTILYINNKPVTYDVDQGFVQMNKEQEMNIINQAMKGSF